MPINIDPELIAQMVKRQVGVEQMQERFAPEVVESAPESKPLSPSLMAALGAAADGASTYRFLKQGTAPEDNTIFGGLDGHPAFTSLAATGTGLAVPLIGKLLQNKLPKGLIEAIGANMGARTLGVAGANFDDGLGESSTRHVTKALTQPQLRHK